MKKSLTLPELGSIIEVDKDTKEWFKKHPDARTTVTQCKNCGLWYKPILDHKCKVKNK